MLPCRRIFVLFLVYNVAHAQQCGPNEEWTDCSTCELSCTDSDTIACPAMCYPPKCQCTASKGLRRNIYGDCVPVSECPSRASSNVAGSSGGTSANSPYQNPSGGGQQLLTGPGVLPASAPSSRPRTPFPPPNVPPAEGFSYNRTYGIPWTHNNRSATVGQPPWRFNGTVTVPSAGSVSSDVMLQNNAPYVNVLPPGSSLVHPTPHAPPPAAVQGQQAQQQPSATAYDRQTRMQIFNSNRYLNRLNPPRTYHRPNGYTEQQQQAYTTNVVPENSEILEGRTYNARQVPLIDSYTNRRIIHSMEQPSIDDTGSQQAASSPYVSFLGPQVHSTPIAFGTQTVSGNEAARPLYTRQALDPYNNPTLMHQQLNPPQSTVGGKRLDQYVSFLGPQIHPTYQTPVDNTAAQMQRRSLVTRQVANSEAYYGAPLIPLPLNPRPLNASNPYAGGQYVNNLGPEVPHPTRGPNHGFQIPGTLVARQADLPVEMPHQTRGPNHGFQVPGTLVARQADLPMSSPFTSGQLANDRYGRDLPVTDPHQRQNPYTDGQYINNPFQRPYIQ